jgi:hypothetical protein
MSIPDSVRVKIERADHHVANLNTAINEFLKVRPYHILRYVDPGKRPTYQATDIQPIPLPIAAIVGDVLQNLRTALDYMASALWSRTNAGEFRGYFPIAETPAKYKSEGLGKIKGLCQCGINAISAIEPYAGGKGDVLWRLHSLSIIDKHRLPIVVAAAHLGVHLPTVYPELFPQSAKSNPWILGVTDMRCPLKDKDILFRDDPDRELNQDLEFPSFVAINEPSVFNCQPIIPALRGFIDSVNNVGKDLAPLFA